MADAKDLLESNLAGVSGADRSVELTVETYPGPDVILLVTCICGTVTVTQKLLVALIIYLLVYMSIK